MAFPMSFPVSRQTVIPVLLWKFLSVGKLFDDCIYQFNIKMPFHSQLIVFFKLL